jgi:hypothetical protein
MATIVVKMQVNDFEMFSANFASNDEARGRFGFLGVSTLAWPVNDCGTEVALTERILMMATGLAVLVVGCTSSALPGAGGAVAADAAVVGLLDCAAQADCDVAAGAEPSACKGKADCDDHNGCTVDNCDLKTGCAHEPLLDDSPCDAGTACWAGDKCKAGVCVAATGKPWDKTWGGTASDEVAALVGLPDGGFVLAGATASKGAGSDECGFFASMRRAARSGRRPMAAPTRTLPPAWLR